MYDNRQVAPEPNLHSYHWSILVLVPSLSEPFPDISVTFQFSTQAFESYQLVDELLVDYASGMAHSFFHGYLNIVLPEKGTDEKGLKELMRDYESSQGIEFAQYKLFVLVPLSMYCPATIEEFAPSIETSRVKSVT